MRYRFMLQHVPLLVEVCIHKIEENGLHNKGIYRVPGNTATIASLQADIEKVICVFIRTVLLYNFLIILMFF